MKRVILNQIKIVVILLLALVGCAEKETQVEVSSVSLNTATIEMVEGETFSLVATVLPKDAEYDGVIWASSNASVAGVNSGTVTAIKEGTATITASAGGKSSTCTVNISTKVVSVTSITLDKRNLSIKVGEKEALMATVLPENATDKTVAWSSSDESVVKVDNGKVTAIKSGKATVTAKCGGRTAECAVTVTVPVSSVTLDKTTLSLAIGESAILTATVRPDDATDKTVVWSSSDESIAKVANGKVTAKKLGIVTITAKSGKCTAECVVNVTNASVESITLDKTSLSLSVGETATLVADVKPSNAATVTWSSSNPSVATVKDGVVAAVGLGVTEVLAEVKGKSAKCLVNVFDSSKKDYFYFCTSHGTNDVTFVGPTLEYSYDGINWQKWNTGEGKNWLKLTTDSKLFLRGVEGLSTKERMARFRFKTTEPNVICRGNVNVLYYYLSELVEVKTPYAFSSLFEGAEALITAPDLPLKSLSEYCYKNMFEGCSSLIAAPELPALNLSRGCYEMMFYGCKSLAKAPKELPAKQLYADCYNSMFKSTAISEAPIICATSTAEGSCKNMFTGCKSLKKVQTSLQATSLARSCYEGMFSSCVCLENAPSLPATELFGFCYREMFLNCRSLIKAPFLPAIKVGLNSYKRMFKDCKSLKECQDELPATIIMNESYCEMFSGCVSLIKAPNILATTIGERSCSRMFYGCSSMTKAPDILPATTLDVGCYEWMFYGCSSITRAPVLPAHRIVDESYCYMFDGCSKLNNIKCMAIYSSWNCTESWVKGVALFGTFIRNSNKGKYDYYDIWKGGSSGIPQEWTVVEVDE